MGLKKHPVAELFPKMDKAQYESFRASIKEFGQKVDCLTWKGQLVDGVHRERACEDLGLKCRYKPIGIEDEAAMVRHVTTLNLERRHMSVTQKGIVAVALKKEIARIMREGQREAGKKGAAHGKKGGRGNKKPLVADPPQGVSSGEPKKPAAKKPAERKPAAKKKRAPAAREVAAAAVGVGSNTVSLIERVIEKAPDLEQPMRDGKMTAHAANAEVKRRERKAEMEAKAAAAAEAPDAGECQITTGDCVEGMKAIKAGTVRLVFADPPYNIGVDYGKGEKADKLKAKDYLSWCRTWVEEIARILAADGSAWILINDEWADHFGVMFREVGLHRRQWLIWYESFGVNVARGFNRCSRHLFWLVKDPESFVFNEEAVRRPSDRQAVHNDKRANPDGKNWDSVWGINPEIRRVAGTMKERINDFPTQLPLALLNPIVLCASEPGDLVVDPFTGSGTTAEAAVSAGRRFRGFELNPEYADVARIRVKANVKK